MAEDYPTHKNYSVDDKDIADALEVIENYEDQRIQHDEEIDLIQELLQEAFTISAPKGTRRISGQRLFQALWRTASRMKPLDFMVHGTGATPEKEKIVRDGISTVMDRGNYDSCLRDKNGAFFDLLLYGDALVQIGSNEGNGFPILFSNTTLKNIYVNTSATGVRVPQRGRGARQLVLVAEYTKGEFGKLWPKFKKKVKCGRIARAINGKEQQMTAVQDSYDKKDKKIEVAYSYNLDTECFVVFAGADHIKLEKYKGEKYPFIKDEESYIPVLQYICFPSSEGFWNKGIGHLLYRLAIIQRQLMNMEIQHVFDNTLPIELVSVAQGKAAAFFQGLKQAHKMRAQGKRGFVPLERSSNDPNASTVSSQTLLTQNLYNEWQAVFDRLDQEIRRLGINIDEIDPAGNKTATEVIALEENSNAFVKQIGEWNGSEYQFAIEITMDMIKQFVKKNDKTPLDLTTKIKVNDEEKKVEGIDLGMIAEELKENRWFVRVDLRSGNILSNTMKFTRYNSLLQYLPPGTPQHAAAIKSIADFFEVDLPEEQQQQPQDPNQQPGEPGDAIPRQAAGTDRQEINPNVAMRGPAL